MEATGNPAAFTPSITPHQHRGAAVILHCTLHILENIRAICVATVPLLKDGKGQSCFHRKAFVDIIQSESFLSSIQMLRHFEACGVKTPSRFCIFLSSSPH